MFFPAVYIIIASTVSVSALENAGDLGEVLFGHQGVIKERK